MKKVLVLLVLASMPCLADNQIEFNFGRGTPESSVQAGGSSDHAGSRGGNWSLDILHVVAPHVYLGLGGGYFHSSDNVSQTFVSNADSTIVSHMTSVFVLSRADMGDSSRVLPYFIAGMGWVQNYLRVTSGPTTLLDDSKDTMGFVTGLGMDVALTDRLFIGLEGRYQTSFKRTFDFTAAGQSMTGQANLQAPLNIFILGIKAGIKY